MDKKNINILGIFVIFILGFLVHNIYDWFPSFVFVPFFPINESIFEHIKMIFTSYLIWTIIKYFLLKRNEINDNNYIFKELLTSFFEITLFLLIYIPVYNNCVESLTITLFIYFVTITISQIFNNHIKFKKNYDLLKILSIIVIFIIYVISTYLAYKPPINSFFIDSTNNSYGLNK